jgi:hypothetical protein
MEFGSNLVTELQMEETTEWEWAVTLDTAQATVVAMAETTNVLHCSLGSLFRYSSRPCRFVVHCYLIATLR